MCREEIYVYLIGAFIYKKAMGRKQIQRLQDIRESNNSDILIFSEQEKSIADTIAQENIKRLLPLLTQKQLNEKEYGVWNSLLKTIEHNIKEILSIHAQKELVFLKDTAKLQGNQLIPDITYASYEDNFNNPTKISLDQEHMQIKQQKIFEILLEKITAWKISKRANAIMDVKLWRVQDKEMKCYQHNSLSTTINDLQFILDKNKAIYLEKKEKQDTLFKQFKIIHEERNRYKNITNTVRHFQNKSIIDTWTPQHFSAYLKGNKITVKSHAWNDRPMIFEDIKKKFLSFGEEYFSDETWIAIISWDKPPVTDKIKAYNNKIVENAEHPETKKIKNKLKNFFQKEKNQQKDKQPHSKKYNKIFSYGFTDNALARLHQEYDIDLGESMHAIADQFGWLEHILQDRKMCEKYLYAIAHDDREGIHNIISERPITITWPMGEAIQESTRKYINLAVRDKALEDKKENMVTWSNKTRNTNWPRSMSNGHRNSPKLQGAIHWLWITKEEVIKNATAIFPQETYSHQEYRKYYSNLSKNEQKDRPINLRHIVSLFDVHPEYYRADLLKALIHWDTKKSTDIIKTKNIDLQQKSYKPAHIKTLLVLCEILENKNKEWIYMELHDLQITSYNDKIDKQYGLSRRTVDNFTSIQQKYWITKNNRRKSPQALRSNLLWKYNFRTDTEELYQELMQRKKQLLKEGIFTEDNIAAILAPQWQKHINKPLKID